MGAAESVLASPIEMLTKTYGGDFAKFVCAEKAKQFIESKLPGLKNQLSEKTSLLGKNAQTQIEQAQKKTTASFQSKVDEITKQNPTAVQSAQKLSGKPITSIFGLDVFNDKFAVLKAQSTEHIDGINQKILNQTDILAAQQKQIIDNSKPHVPIYDDLPEVVKKNVMEEANTKFGPEIAEKTKEQEQFLKSKLSFDALSQSLTANLPSKQATAISTEAEAKFKEVQQTIKGTHCDSCAIY